MRVLLAQYTGPFQGIRCKLRVLDYYNNLAVSMVFQVVAGYNHLAYCESEEKYPEGYGLAVNHPRM